MATQKKETTGGEKNLTTTATPVIETEVKETTFFNAYNEPKQSKYSYLDIRFKKLCKEAKTPKYAHKGDAGLDIVATSKNFDKEGNVVYGTGIALQIPKGYVGLIFPRSSNAKYDLLLTNCVGVIDSTYRGEVMFKFKPIKKRLLSKPKTYNVGDRVGQLIIMPYPKVTLREVKELSITKRGEGGYGSTGK